MHHSQIILNIFQEQGLSAYKASKETGISESLFSKWRIHPTSEISSKTLTKIADYLDCSVDYLLGRTSGASLSVAQAGTGNVNGNISNSTLSIANTSELSEYEADIIRVFRSLTPKKKTQVMSYIYDLEEQVPPVNS